ncbi:TonB-linked SusC/RagA family outer membrane protein [Leeuwenhoekiella aestuarii]|uniref:TonB-linked SusC/RagA family outer membrane protein n=2 Tax=Leeuwenhoekiella aestuarii TaxID=2249426 RepID=A0A4Q0NSW0_9FLAO|nr:TonB-dependent receptor [Leeuwenhoekiella aestuarii]RXG13335.1 TonB-linked SusC/RagA family outer membrane protein [Leeuwenhoekiella aestuarii]RXG14934.1 TonB-linked SusC/RagA family outer membrane protein [Leeuwenhoekiella aestuarii]
MKKHSQRWSANHSIYLLNLKMSITAVLITLISVFQVQANSYSQNKLSLDLEQVSVIEIISAIEAKSNYKFLFNRKDVNLEQKVTVIVNDQPIDEVLKKVFKNSSIDYEILNNQIILKKAVSKNSQSKKQNQYEISGVILDPSGQPLPGANIVEKGTKNGATSDFDGSFTLTVGNPNATLVITYIGFTTQEIPLEGQTSVSVKLEENAASLDELVVVGYGKQKKYSVISSVATIEPEELQTSSSRSLSNNLAGRLAGVIAVQRSGETGYDNSQFWIRGISSFAGNSTPLVLVDGIERSLNNIDPAEIATFSILKDAAASAVYGVRGANGVILITTKRGKIAKPSFNARYEHSLTQPTQLPEFIGAAEYLEVFNAIAREEGNTEPFSQDRIDNIRSGIDPDLFPDVNWLDEITKDYGSSDRLNLTVTGGTDLLRYAFVASYYGEDGIIENDPRQEWDSSPHLDRYNMRSNLDLNMTPTTLFRVSIGGFLQDLRRAPQNVNELLNLAFETPPYQHPTQYSSGEIPVQPERANPWALATQTGYERQSASKLESLFSVEQDLDFVIQGLSTTFKFSFDRYNANSVRRAKQLEYYNPATGRNEDGSLDLIVYRFGQDFLGYETGSEWGNKAVYLEGRVEYSNNFKGDHQVDGLFLYNQRNYDDGSRLPYRNQGFAGRAAYSYKRRYIAEFNFGYNGSENFAKGKRYGFFPSAAVGWVISEEDFLKDNKAISNLKLRASYGLAGNDQIDGRRFAYITTIGDTNGYRWGVNNDYQRAGRWEGDYGVPNLTWETVAKANLGVNLGLWNSINITADVFNEVRSDIFMQRRTVPGSSGFVNNPWSNYGKVKNQGFEVSLDVNKRFNDDFSIRGWGNFSYAHNEILEQDEPAAIIGTNRSSTGESVGQIFGLLDDGLFTNEDFADIDNGILNDEVPEHTFGNVRPGDIKYKDLDGDGRITELDRTAIGGSYTPEIVYGFGFNMQYKSFDLGAFFQGNANTYRIIGGNYFSPGSGQGGLGNIYTNYTDRWTVDNPQQDVFWPRLSSSPNANNDKASTWWLRDMSMLRLKNVEFGYTFPKRLTEKISSNNARLYVRGNNVLTLSSFKLWDPEIDTGTGFTYPPMQSIALGLDIIF